MSDGGTYAGFAIGYARDTSIATCLVRHPVRMRVKPTSVENSTIALTCRGISGVSISSISYYDGSSDAAMLDVTASGLTQFRIYDLSNNGTTGYLGFSAEL